MPETILLIGILKPEEKVYLILYRSGKNEDSICKTDISPNEILHPLA